MNSFRLVVSLLLASSAFGTSVARAAISGHSSAICGGVLRAVEAVERSVAEGVAPAGYLPFTIAEPDLRAFAKTLDRFDGKAAAEARKKIALHVSRSGNPGVRTTAFLFSGEGAIEFLKSASVEAKKVGAQAGKRGVFNPLLIGAFGARSLLSLLAIPTLLEMDPDKRWYAVPAALFAIAFGKPVVKAILRMRKSPLEKFMVDEFSRLGAATGEDALHVLSMTGKSTSDFKTIVDFEANARAPWAQQMVFDARPYGMTRAKRVLRGKNPLVVPRKTARIDLIAIPYGDRGDRQILVLTAEGF